MVSIREIQQLVDEGLQKTGLNAAEASRMATEKDDAIRSIKKGNMPALDRWHSLCKVLKIDFYTGFQTGPAKKTIDAEGHTKALETARLSSFEKETGFVARGYARCSDAGDMEKEEERPEVPAPEGVRDIDPDAFYVIAKGSSMVPEGIEDGYYCLVLPNAPLQSGQRVWLKNREGRACIKRLIDVSDEAYTVRNWLDPEDGSQSKCIGERAIKDIAEQGVVLAVYDGPPDIDNPPSLIPDPTPRTVALPVTPELLRSLGLPPGSDEAVVSAAVTDRLHRFCKVEALIAYPAKPAP